MSGTRRR